MESESRSAKYRVSNIKYTYPGMYSFIEFHFKLKILF